MIIWKNILIEQNRKTTEKENLELKNNIMQLGLINPITLIKVDDNQFKVVAGRRRAMALQELYPNGLEEKHYRIMDKDEKIIAFSENSIRKNLSMREEIEQLKQLKEQCPDATIKELALRLGRSQSTITRRLAIAVLEDKYLDYLDDPDVKIERMEELALLPKEQQERISLYELQRNYRISAFACSMEEVLSPECKSCQHNTASNALFDDDVFCLNKTCYFEQYKNIVMEKISEAKNSKKHLIVAANYDMYYLWHIKIPCYFFSGNNFNGTDIHDGIKVDFLVCKIGKKPYIVQSKIDKQRLEYYSVISENNIQEAQKELISKKEKLQSKIEKLEQKYQKKIFEYAMELFYKDSQYNEAENFVAFLANKASGNLCGLLYKNAWQKFIKGISQLPLYNISLILPENLNSEQIKQIFERDIKYIKETSAIKAALNNWNIDFDEYTNKSKKLMPPIDVEVDKLKAEIKEIDKVLYPKHSRNMKRKDKGQ